MLPSRESGGGSVASRPRTTVSRVCPSRVTLARRRPSRRRPARRPVRIADRSSSVDLRPPRVSDRARRTRGRRATGGACAEAAAAVRGRGDPGEHARLPARGGQRRRSRPVRRRHSTRKVAARVGSRPTPAGSARSRPGAAAGWGRRSAEAEDPGARGVVKAAGPRDVAGLPRSEHEIAVPERRLLPGGGGGLLVGRHRTSLGTRRRRRPPPAAAVQTDPQTDRPSRSADQSAFGVVRATSGAD